MLGNLLQGESFHLIISYLQIYISKRLGAWSLRRGLKLVMWLAPTS